MQSLNDVHIHFTWTTLLRAPLLTPNVEASVHRARGGGRLRLGVRRHHRSASVLPASDRIWHHENEPPRT